MIKDIEIFDKIELLEKQLLSPSVRSSVDSLDELLSFDFKEISSSGLVYTKQEILDKLPQQKTRYFIIESFEVRLLENKIYLANYVTVENSIKTLCSSIWKMIDEKLRIIFHQGTELKNIK